MDQLATTEAAVSALRAIAAEYGREIEVSHDTGADQTSRFFLIVPLPGDRTHTEFMPMITLTPWPSSRVQ
jgi:hypothetical protein